MGASLSVLNIKNALEKEKFQKDEFEIRHQKAITEEENVNGGQLSRPKTEISKTGKENGFIKYVAEMSSTTIEKPIYIFDDGYEEWDEGYQEINHFEFWIDEDFNRLYVFAPKKVSNTFSKRLNRRDHLDCNSVSFDLSKVSELEDLDSAWGSWEDSEGIVKRKAKFGKDIDDAFEEADYDSITTIYIDYMYGSEPVQLILNHQGRISTQNGDIENKDVFKIFSKAEEILVEEE